MGRISAKTRSIPSRLLGAASVTAGNMEEVGEVLVEAEEEGTDEGAAGRTTPKTPAAFDK